MHDPCSPQPVTPVRRHDLDALRAFAMLLGIALHAALAYAPVPWIAMDRQTSPVLGAFVEITHGFRLPLFFLMSGFFSAMLLRRRGIGGFLRHRARRIALPLLLGLFTIIPAMWIVIIGGSVLREIVPPPAREWGGEHTQTPTIWSAAAAGDLPTVQNLVRAGVPVNEPDPRVFTLPLAWASTGDHADIVAFLLESGADPNARMGDENTPMHTALFFGAAASAERMLDAGGDLTLRNRGGETPIDSMRHGPGAVDYIADLLGVTADFEQVEAGREAIRADIEARGDTPVVSDPADATRSPLRGILDAMLGGELFMHLWFLWHLCWLAGGLAVLALLVRALPPLRIPASLVTTPLCLVVLIPLTALTQSQQANFGPDTSAGLIPAPHVLVHYAVFFGFGALMHTTPDAADRLGRWWWAHLPIGAIAGGLALRLVHDPLAFADPGIDGAAAPFAGSLLQAVFVWTVAFGLMGLFRVLLRRPSARVRYISDASYWLYVAHLPIVVAGQFVLAYVPLPAVAEFAVLTVATTACLLLSYRWCVRYTWIGRLLNGPRERPSPLGSPPPDGAAAPAIGAR